MHNPTLEIAHQTILEHLPVAILIVDNSGLVHYHNQEADNFFSPGFLESANVIKLSDDLNKQDFHNVLNKLHNHSSVVKFNIRFKHKQRTRCFVLKMIINPDDSLEAFPKESTTEKKHLYLITLDTINEEPSAGKEPSAHKEPSAYNESSAEKELSAHKEASAYKKNFKELKQFSRLSAMREISSSLADKLNQPLTAIISYTQAMQRLYQNNASSDEIDKAMQRVVVNAENAGQIIKNVRAQLNTNTLNYQNVCLNHLIQESIHLTELDSPASLIKLVTHYEPSGMTLCIDKVQMRQVIFSLVNNAIDAVMEHSTGYPEIILTTRLSVPDPESDLSAGLHDDSHYEIIIADNGPGFPEEIQNKLFEPFTTTKKNGIGIGLSMCHHIIGLHNGSISIISDNAAKENPRDTQFATVVTICLPLNSDNAKNCQ